MSPRIVPLRRSRIWWAVWILTVFQSVPAPAALHDILRFEDKMDKTVDMSGKIYDTKSLRGVNQYDGLKEFRTSPLKDMPTFPLPGANKSFDKSYKVSESRVFNGKAYIDTKQSYHTSAASGFSGNYSTRKAPGFDSGPNPMGDKSYRLERERYQGPELERKTTEIEIINQTLKNKEDLKGGVLSMGEVREILNKRE